LLICIESVTDSSVSAVTKAPISAGSSGGMWAMVSLPASSRRKARISELALHQADGGSHHVRLSPAAVENEQ
jgi:hypothetical protein